MRIIGARNELCVFIRDYAQEFSIGDVEKVSNLAKKSLVVACNATFLSHGSLYNRGEQA